MEVTMKKLSSIPQELLNKAAKIIELFLKGVKRKWKKLSGLNNYYSYRLSMNYRLLADSKGNFFIGCHDAYSAKIKAVKKCGR